MAAHFYTSRNNGVTAAISYHDAKRYGELKAQGKDPFEHGVKVFIFDHTSKYKQNLLDRMVYTGDLEFFERLLRAGKLSCQVNVPNVTGWDGFVPLSNQEHRMNPDGNWCRYVTTAEDVTNYFGLLPHRFV